MHVVMISIPFSKFMILGYSSHRTLASLGHSKLPGDLGKLQSSQVHFFPQFAFHTSLKKQYRISLQSFSSPAH